MGGGLSGAKSPQSQVSILDLESLMDLWMEFRGSMPMGKMVHLYFHHILGEI